MSTTKLKLRCVPEYENGVSVSKLPTAAWVFGPWKTLAQFTNSDLYIYGLQFQITTVVTANTTYEMLLSLGFGPIGQEVEKIRLPYSYRSSTSVGYYLNQVGSIFLPEPMLVPQYTTVSVRFTGNVASSQDVNGVKLLYM